MSSPREWISKDFYRELGVSSDATADEIKKAYRKLAKENHPDANPGNAEAEKKFKAVSEAHGVLSDPAKRKEYDEAKRLFGSGGFGGFGGGQSGGFDVGDIFGGAAGGQQQGGFGGLGDILGGLFGRGRSAGATANRPQRGADVETDVRIDFVEAVKGATLPLRLSSPATCSTCGGNGAKPGTTPRTCPTCSGSGLVSRSQGSFAFSEPCRDCRGRGTIIDDPCPECAGEGISSKTRTLTVRIPPGVSDDQRIRLAGQGEPGRGGAQAGDLYVRVHVADHPVFGRKGLDLTITVPVAFTELALGGTITVPTLDGRVSIKVPSGTASGRTFRARGKGITKRDGAQGDLLVTVQASVPSKLDDAAREALEAYAKAMAEHDPRPEITELLRERGA
ncbi:molecular chaperone DnaJ [Amycolatopsis xylanica]|uniref:Chaperone protein DnaJ n=1 Tax=Amycolatopsis xylanica TaxID=589385 RepID=A0A1H3A8S2_9PSEU|nr:molecular chaperone DnaJ [Amycolatopsis xylanica]SDX25708.1 molecular chaperone DnaJ [Amycolatopsis xylanica]